MRIQTSIRSTYRPRWGIPEAIREFIQNALDAQDQGHHMRVVHDGQRLLVHTEGVKLDLSVWLTGETTKENDPSKRGHFGDGLPVGTLAALRAGLDVEFLNGDEWWRPTIEPLDSLPGKEVLTVTTRPADKDSGGFFVVIRGLSEETWGALRRRYLHLCSPESAVDCSGLGRILWGPHYAGKVFVKGLYVCSFDDLAHGYDLLTVRTDAERSQVARGTAELAIAKLWDAAVVADSTLIPQLLEIAPDKKDLSYLSIAASGTLLDILKTWFCQKYGEKATPICSEAEAKEVGHHGRHGAVLPSLMVQLLEHRVPGLSRLRLYEDAEYTIVPRSNLTPAETLVLDQVVGMVDEAAQALGHVPVENRTQVAAFSAPAYNGFRLGDGQLLLGRHVLGDRKEAIRVLVHEVGHDRGGEGTKDHELAQGRLHSWIEDSLLDGKIDP